MDCLYLEERLEALALGELPVEERLACEEHLDSCPDCQELLELALLSGDASQDNRLQARPPDLVAAVLKESSADPCGRALRLLSSARETPLHGTDNELVAGHLASCSECTSMADVLAKLEQDLPRMALLRPDPAFVDDVLRETLPASVRLRRWWKTTWPGLVRRPRFASEAAYVGLLALVVVFATPTSPLQAIPGRTLAIIKDQGLNTLQLPSVDLAARFEGTTRILRESESGRALTRWQATSSGIVERTTELANDVGTQFGTLWDRAASLLERSDEELSSPAKPKT